MKPCGNAPLREQVNRVSPGCRHDGKASQSETGFQLKLELGFVSIPAILFHCEANLCRRFDEPAIGFRYDWAAATGSSVVGVKLVG